MRFEAGSSYRRWLALYYEPSVVHIWSKALLNSKTGLFLESEILKYALNSSKHLSCCENSMCDCMAGVETKPPLTSVEKYRGLSLPLQSHNNHRQQFPSLPPYTRTFQTQPHILLFLSSTVVGNHGMHNRLAILTRQSCVFRQSHQAPCYEVIPLRPCRRRTTIVS